MELERVCKRCLLRESGQTETLESIRIRIEKLSPAERAPQSVYAARLAQCAACDHLVAGVCMKCGCYPEFRAAFRRQRCPVKQWEK